MRNCEVMVYDTAMESKMRLAYEREGNKCLKEQRIATLIGERDRHSEQKEQHHYAPLHRPKMPHEAAHPRVHVLWLPRPETN
jgi:hypothetical protein